MFTLHIGRGGRQVDAQCAGPGLGARGLFMLPSLCMHAKGKHKGKRVYFCAPGLDLQHLRMLLAVLSSPVAPHPSAKRPDKYVLLRKDWILRSGAAAGARLRSREGGR